MLKESANTPICTMRAHLSTKLKAWVRARAAHGPRSQDSMSHAMFTANMRAPCGRRGVNVPHRLVQFARLPERVSLWWSPCERTRRQSHTNRPWAGQRVARIAASRVRLCAGRRGVGTAKAGRLGVKTASKNSDRVTDRVHQEGAPRGLRERLGLIRISATANW